ncbi:hypothetical protein FHR93_005247 [Geodermatophilus sabuli]|nr:GNAT family N-acetyltransferase [Geodermatophilus sabuli]MBB3087008.1 hypothetical protein [Geodermatophilus sabuli]
MDTQTGRAIGGVVATLFARSQVLLVAYLAVRPDLRQGGLGRHLVDQARLRWAGLEAKLILAEVHDPRYHASTDPWAWSRVQLYDEMGARALALPFVQPEVRRGAGRARHFLLLVFHAEPSVVTDVGAGSSVTASVLEDFVLDYYADAEGPSRADDGDLAWLVGRLRAGTAVPLLPLSRLDEVPRDPRSG